MYYIVIIIYRYPEKFDQISPSFYDKMFYLMEAVRLNYGEVILNLEPKPKGGKGDFNEKEISFENDLTNRLRIQEPSLFDYLERDSNNLYETMDYVIRVYNNSINERTDIISEFKKIEPENSMEVISVLNHTDAQVPFKVHQKMPYKTFNAEDFKPDFDKKYVVICKKGITSYDVTLKLKEKYPALAIFSLVDGIDNY